MEKVADWGEMTMAGPENKTPGKSPARPDRRRANLSGRKSAMVLDMGEASRAEGFRLNGCR